MAINGSDRYATPAAFRRSLEDRLRAAAKARGRTINEVRREFAFQRFLALLFSSAASPWVLKGGGSLLMRLADARFSKDLDLVRTGALDAEAAVHELRQLTTASVGDHLRFEVDGRVRHSAVNPVVEISVTAMIGARQIFDRFPIDLATELHVLATPERIRPANVVDIPGMPGMPEVVVYPLSDQVADMVAAMYELHGEDGHPSSRYRDLADLVLIVTSCELDAAEVSAALLSEARRRAMTLPSGMVLPGPAWRTGYTALARKSRLAPAYHDPDAAITCVGQCLDPILAHSLSNGRWAPGTGWR